MQKSDLFNKEKHNIREGVSSHSAVEQTGNVTLSGFSRIFFLSVTWRQKMSGLWWNDCLQLGKPEIIIIIKKNTTPVVDYFSITACPLSPDVVSVLSTLSISGSVSPYGWVCANYPLYFISLVSGHSAAARQIVLSVCFKHSGMLWKRTAVSFCPADSLSIFAFVRFSVRTKMDILAKQ